MMKTYPEKKGLNAREVSVKSGPTAISALLFVVLVTELWVSSPAALGANLGDLSIEELMNETVTSVSKREQRLADSAAAIAVLSNDDLRRSGALDIMDALRLVPGLDVGAIDSSQSAISARGFNVAFSNKLLVVVDGRTVYNPIFGGVVWDLQQTMLDDVDRIEVIRGPGATVWGANAVNGVINVVSRSARETQGGLLYGGAGNVHERLGGVRYGGQIDKDTYFRVFGSYRLSADSRLASGQSAGDGWQSRSGGFRLDRYPETATHLTLQAEATVSDLDDHASNTSNANILGRWTRQLSDRLSIEVQAYYDRTNLNETMLARATGDTLDLTAQQTFAVSPSNDVVWGLGYRFDHERIQPTSPSVRVRKSHFSLNLFSAFLQDEFKVVPERLTLSAGLKVEHNDYTGFEFQPSVRAVFKPEQHETIWAAISRAVRTPDAAEGRDMFGIPVGPPFPGPGGGLYLPTVTGNGSPNSEVSWAYEFGYRLQPATNVSLDFAAFYNRYSGLISPGNIARFLPGIPFGTAEIPLVNLVDGHTHGAEISIVVSPTDAWRLTTSYSLLIAKFDGPAIANPAAQETTSPRHQVSLRSAYEFTKRASFDAQIRSVGGIQSVPSYVTADIRLSYRPTDRLEFSLIGQNLLEHQHLEQASTPQTVTAEVRRGVYGRFSWRF